MSTDDEARAAADRLARADHVDEEVLAGALETALGVARRGRGSVELPPVVELVDDLADCYERLGRVDEAVAAMREAISAGWNGVPDGRCRIAEILTSAGRVEEATVIWEQVAAEYPDDVWVFNNAGIEYARAGEHVTALGYLDRGLQLALDAGDPERLVDQLAEFRGATLTALGRGPDQLQDRASEFLADPPSRATGPSVAAEPLVGPVDAPVGAEDRVAMAFAWFPREAYTEAITRWPELPACWGASDYPGYCAGLEAHLSRFAETTGTAPLLAAIDIDSYLAWCTETGSEPGERASRAGYAADRAHAGHAVAWPPGRNRPCWCGSGRKYKHCCRTAARGQ